MDEKDKQKEEYEKMIKTEMRAQILGIEKNYQNLKQEMEMKMRKMLQKEEDVDKRLEECRKREKEEGRREEVRKEDERRREKEMERRLEEERRRRIKAEENVEKMRRDREEGDFFREQEEKEDFRNKDKEEKKEVEMKIESLILGDGEGNTVLNDSSMIANKLIGSQMKHLLESGIRGNLLQTSVTEFLSKERNEKDTSPNSSENEIDLEEEEEAKLSDSGKGSELNKTAPRKIPRKLKVLKGGGQKQEEMKEETNIVETKKERKFDCDQKDVWYIIHKAKEIESVCQSKAEKANETEMQDNKNQLNNLFNSNKIMKTSPEDKDLSNPFLITNYNVQEKIENKAEENKKLNPAKREDKSDFNPFLAEASITSLPCITSMFPSNFKIGREGNVLFNKNANVNKKNDLNFTGSLFSQNNSFFNGSNDSCEKNKTSNFFGETRNLGNNQDNTLFHFPSKQSNLFGNQSEIKKEDQFSNIFISKSDQYFGKK